MVERTERVNEEEKKNLKSKTLHWPGHSLAQKSRAPPTVVALEPSRASSSFAHCRHYIAPSHTNSSLFYLCHHSHALHSPHPCASLSFNPLTPFIDGPYYFIHFPPFYCERNTQSAFLFIVQHFLAPSFLAHQLGFSRPPIKPWLYPCLQFLILVVLASSLPIISVRWDVVRYSSRQMWLG